MFVLVWTSTGMDANPALAGLRRRVYDTIRRTLSCNRSYSTCSVRSYSTVVYCRYVPSASSDTTLIVFFVLEGTVRVYYN